MYRIDTHQRTLALEGGVATGNQALPSANRLRTICVFNRHIFSFFFF